MFPGCFQDALMGLLAGWNLMIISDQSMNFKDPKESNDPQLFVGPQLFDDQSEVWTLIIEKSTVIPPSLWSCFYLCAKI